MKIISITKLLFLFLFVFTNGFGFAQSKFNKKNEGEKQIFTISANKLTLDILFEKNTLSGAKITPAENWLKTYKSNPFSVETSEGFKLHTVWTSWRAPYKDNNGDIEYDLTQKDFVLLKHTVNETENNTTVIFNLADRDEKVIKLDLIYSLDKDKNYFRRKIVVYDTTFEAHFLDKIYPYNTIIKTPAQIFNKGNYGQPTGLLTGDGGFFQGIEYPAATNTAELTTDNKIQITSWQEIGEKIAKKPIESNWVVVGITPDKYVKKWFNQYMNDIRVVPTKPYALYNSWYDLRSVEYPRVEPKYWMTEQNILRVIGLIQKNMIEKHGIKLDAVVLDDGWDVYDSDWKMRTKELPNGLKPISEELAKTNTNLGIWFGPTGGYSFRKRRINWMRQNGYEVVGKEYAYNAMSMCVGGKNYSELLKQRTVDMVKNQGVKYFKWDGIQFSCSEPNHGHPVGLYSRRAVMETMIDWTQKVRAANPEVYLNITSGTWLSPWWLQYSNQIWMDGGDHGWSDVPSISMRDAAITYRDGVLYEDFTTKNLWFPIANLMTHGIIKGDLERLGGEDDPLDKFTHDALFYFARGVMMYELYISPDILNDGEWNAISQSLKWARENADILINTEMIGGNPNIRETYGYVHFKDNRGIIALRNPAIKPNNIDVKLDPAHGLNPEAKNLVIERIYPSRYIFPKLYSANEILQINLSGYETAVYEIYPVETAKEPLIADIVFSNTNNGNVSKIKWYSAGNNVKILNPGLCNETSLNIQATQTKQSGGKIEFFADKQKSLKNCTYNIKIADNKNNTDAQLAILIKPDSIKPKMKYPNVVAKLNKNNANIKSRNDDGCTWYFIPLANGQNTISVQIETTKELKNMNGNIEFYFIGKQIQKMNELTITTKNKITERVMPPLPLGTELLPFHIFVGESKFTISE